MNTKKLIPHDEAMRSIFTDEEYQEYLKMVSDEMIAATVKSWRAKKNLTSKTVCAAAGISERTLRRIENGQSNPTHYTLCQIAKVCGVDSIPVF